MRRAFVSHSSADGSYVAEMESFFRAAGFEVFNVSAIKPDEKFWPKIEKEVTGCESLFVVITAAFSASEWVKREVEFARTLSKKVIPIWYEDCRLPSTFADRDAIDFRPRTRTERRFDIDRILKVHAVNSSDRRTVPIGHHSQELLSELKTCGNENVVFWRVAQSRCG